MYCTGCGREIERPDDCVPVSGLFGYEPTYIHASPGCAGLLLREYPLEIVEVLKDHIIDTILEGI